MDLEKPIVIQGNMMVPPTSNSGLMRDTLAAANALVEAGEHDGQHVDGCDRF
jgi:hypothetical protein